MRVAHRLPGVTQVQPPLGMARQSAVPGQVPPHTGGLWLESRPHGAVLSVVEVVEIHLDGGREVIGYVITGPGADSTWLYGSLEEAIVTVEELDDGCRPSPGPRM